jgi:hypothetical protein
MRAAYHAGAVAERAPCYLRAMPDTRWSEARAREWYAAQPWLVGCNFLPSSAINQLEMWQAETFDAEGLDRELGWAAGLGMNTVRVYLHDLAWDADPAGFAARLDRLLAIAARQGIRPLLVVFDDCWYEPRPGPQPAPRPGVHNSGWVRSPGARKLHDRASWGRLEGYVGAVVGAHGGDERVLAWDLYNEVTNCFLPTMGRPQPWRALGLAAALVRRKRASGDSLALLGEVFRWARAARPAQPLTAGVWFPDRALTARLVALSDVVSFHHYRSASSLEREVARLARYGRPLLCTEYLARSAGCTLESHLPVFQRERIACWNWGLVDGKSQTKFSWQDQPGGPEPDPWFHDLLRRDGSPYRAEEAALLRRLTGRGRELG